MPNGHHGPDDEWASMERPLVELDPELKAVRLQHTWILTQNHHNWPERSLTRDDGIRRLIQIYLDDENAMTFSLWLCASQDRDGGRYWKKQFLAKAQPIEEIAGKLADLLKQAETLVSSWTETDLEFATTIGG